MDDHDNKVIFNRNLELTSSFVKICVDEGYLDNKRLKEYEKISDMLRKKTENNKLYDLAYDPLPDFIYTTGAITSGQYSESKKFELCKERKIELLNQKIRQSDKTSKITIIAPVAPKGGVNHRWEDLFKAFGVIAGKKSYLSRAKSLMHEDKVALSAFLNQFLYDVKNLEAMAFIAHDFHKKGFFSLVGEDDWLSFKAEWIKFRNAGYEVRAIAVAKSSVIVSLEEYFQLPSYSPAGDSRKFEKTNEIETFKTLSNSGFAAAESADGIKPGVVGYATQKYKNMSKQDRDKFALLVQCGFIASHLGKDSDSLNYWVQAMAFGPLVWDETYTEIVSYFQGYVDANYNSNPDSIRTTYTERCTPLIDKNITKLQKEHNGVSQLESIFTSDVDTVDNRLFTGAMNYFDAFCLATKADFDRIKKTIKPMNYRKLPVEYANAMAEKNSTNNELYLIEKINDEKIILLAFSQPNACSVNVQGVDFLPTKKNMIEHLKLVHVATKDIGMQMFELYVPSGSTGGKRGITELGAITITYAKPEMGYLATTIQYLPPEQAKSFLGITN